MRSKEFLSKLEHDRIVHAIREGESKTSGEIRVHVQRGKLKADPLVVAQKKFQQLQMHKTAGRNAVLIFVAPREHKFAVVGDRAIHEKCGDEFWQRIVEGIQTHFQSENFSRAIVESIEEIGKLLAEHFPKQAVSPADIPRPPHVTAPSLTEYLIEYVVVTLLVAVGATAVWAVIALLFGRTLTPYDFITPFSAFLILEVFRLRKKWRSLSSSRSQSNPARAISPSSHLRAQQESKPSPRQPSGEDTGDPQVAATRGGQSQPFPSKNPLPTSVTRNQRISILIGMAVMVAMWLFPPYFDRGHGGYGQDESGYFFLFYSDQAHHIDFGRLIAQSVVVGVLTIIAFLAFRSSALESGETHSG